MSRFSAIKKNYAMCRRLSSLNGGWTLKYFFDAIHCSSKHGTSPENYFVLRFFELDEQEREKYLTSGRSKAVDKELNKNANEKDKSILASKHLFNKAFTGLVKRDFLYAPEAEFAEFKDFIARHDEFIVKPDNGTQGKGVKKLSSSEISDVSEFFEQCRQNNILLEEVITQHSDLNKINPFSINSVRINAARSSDDIKLIGACIKCGVGRQISDNFHAGGIAYPVDIESGLIIGPGRNNTDLNEYKIHPGTDQLMENFQIPYWNEVLQAVHEGMDLVPSLGYIGWDIAITPVGPEIIEGNFSWPGGNIIQFDRVGKYPIIISCCGERNE